MGSSQSKNNEAEFYKEFEELRTEYNQHYGEVTIFRKKANRELKVMSKHKVFQEERDLAVFLAELERKKRLRTDNVASLLNVIGTQKNQFFAIFAIFGIYHFFTFFVIFWVLCSFSSRLDHRKANWCSSFYKISMIYEYHTKTLDQLIRHRQNYNEDDVKVCTVFARIWLILVEYRRTGRLGDFEGFGVWIEGFEGHRGLSRGHPARDCVCLG